MLLAERKMPFTIRKPVLIHCSLLPEIKSLYGLFVQPCLPKSLMGSHPLRRGQTPSCDRGNQAKALLIT